ncbi:hypothetical protein OG422_27605 [Streptomyces sp. NBC_01525]|uniref:hypothetical protein n=1 Tax=Streptomyces sp. NBC_01525 TaxID=2903893 RepID=UPI00386ECEAC
MHPTPVTPERDGWLLTHSAPFLDPGETLRGALSVRLDPLAPDTVPQRYRRPKPAAEEKARFTGWQRIFLPVSFVMWLCSLPAGLLEVGARRTWRGIRRVFRGRVWAGGWDSAAGRFVIDARTGTADVAGYDNTHLALAVTDRRLLLLNEPTSPEREAAQLLGAVPHGTYGLRPEPHPQRHRARVDLAFADGSWLALEAPDRRQVPWLGELLASGRG